MLTVPHCKAKRFAFPAECGPIQSTTQHYARRGIYERLPCTHRAVPNLAGSFAMIRRLYVLFSPTPLLLFVFFLAYTVRLEGWGAWAAGPMILPIAAFSAIYGVYGIWLSVRAKSIRWRTLLAVSAVLAGSVAIWLPVQVLNLMF
jgi:hypothetical protein